MKSAIYFLVAVVPLAFCWNRGTHQNFYQNDDPQNWCELLGYPDTVPIEKVPRTDDCDSVCQLQGSGCMRTFRFRQRDCGNGGRALTNSSRVDFCCCSATNSPRHFKAQIKAF